MWGVRAALAVGLTVGVATLGAVACGPQGAVPGSGGAGAAGSGGGEPAWAPGACGVCVEVECAAQIAACDADPTCAAWRACASACPPATPDGDAEPACEAACPLEGSSAGEKARDALLFCKHEGPAATACAACGHSPSVLPPQGCEVSTDPNPCYACEDDNCCETYAAYAADPEAVAIHQCLVACDPDLDYEAYAACSFACFDAHPGGLELYARRAGCVYTLCDDECSDEPVSPCVACYHQACAPYIVACHDSVSCFLLEQCLIPCDPDDAACWDACYQAYGDGDELLSDTINCGLVHCAAECA